MANKTKKTTTKKDKEQKSVMTITGKYIEGIGRRKTAVARVRLAKGSGKAFANEKTFKDYFQVERLRNMALAPLTRLSIDSFDVYVKVNGGGTNAQAEAVRLGIARALVKDDPETKKRLRGYGFLTRDPRAVERKKYGLKKARRAPQWAKR